MPRIRTAGVHLLVDSTTSAQCAMDLQQSRCRTCYSRHRCALPHLTALDHPSPQQQRLRHHSSNHRRRAPGSGGVCSRRDHGNRSFVCRMGVDSAAGQAGTSGNKAATLLASKLGLRRVVEREKPLAAYMALPASQYSVLDGRRVERLTDDSFRCYVGEVQFLTWRVEPVLTVSVNVEEKGCTIKLLSCELEGSDFVSTINDSFAASMTNVVRWREVEDSTDKEILSDTNIKVVLQIPRWSSFLPVSTIESVGSGVMQRVLNNMVPRFLSQLEKDYTAWSAGDTSRKAVE